MKPVSFAAASVLLLISFGTLGCDGGTETASEQQAVDEQQESAGEAAQQYAIHGEVVAVDREKPSVTLDHEEIEGLMKAMQMEFPVDGPQVLEGIAQGDRVQGQLVKKNGKFVILDLQKSAD